MAFTYTATLSQPLDYLRFRLDDKEEEYAEYQDEELQYFIDKVSGTPTELDLDKIALKLLRQQLQEILRGPSRERSGAFEVYGPTAGSLSAAIKDLEDEINNARPAKPFFGGVNRSDVQATREDSSVVEKKFYEGSVYSDPDDSFFPSNIGG